jgi:hypothetical protein
MSELATGEVYPVRVTCPACHESGLVPMTLASRVTMTEGESSRVSIKASAPRLPHLCGQTTIDEALRALEERDK